MEHNPDAAASVITLEAALNSHQQWKENLRCAVRNKELIDTSAIGRDDCCDLGKWLYSGAQQHYWGKPEFQSLLLHHREFHMLTGAVAEVINRQQYELAEAYLSSDTQLAQSSSEVGGAIRRLEAAIRA
jgi:methyl-accepting chemotaxis protein